MYRMESVRKYTHQEKTIILKFIAKYPFEEIDFGDCGSSQIMKVNYASQEVTLRDFCEYSVEDIVDSEGFLDKKINRKWKRLIRKI